MTISAQVSWLTSPFELSFKTEELNENCLADNAILCETLVSAISPGTEIAAYSGMAPLRPGNIYPRLVGYCNVANVIRCGRDVQSIQPGDRILSSSSHRSHFLIGENEILAVIPDGVSNEHAACTYLYHLGYDALIKSDIKYGSPVVIIGLGVLGLGAVAVAANAGANVYAISDQAIPSEAALKSGATAVFKRDQFKALLKILNKRLADCVITTTNSWQDWDSALRLAGNNGIISVLGFPGRNGEKMTTNPFDSQYFYTKQLRIQAAGMSPRELDSREFLKFNQKTNIAFLLEQIRVKKLNPDLFISSILPWHQLKKAYESLYSRQNSPITCLLQWKN